MTNLIKKVSYQQHNGRNWDKFTTSVETQPTYGRWCVYLDEGYYYYSTDYKGDYGKDRKFTELDDVITLSNGKKVANFSSPHAFTFEDGSVLQPITESRCKSLSLITKEVEHDNGDVELKFIVTDEVKLYMELWGSAKELNLVDVVYIPMPMMSALKEIGYDVKNSPFRVIRLTDRINKIVSITTQCI